MSSIRFCWKFLVSSIVGDSSPGLNSHNLLVPVTSHTDSPPDTRPRPPNQLRPYLHRALALLLDRTRPCDHQLLLRLLSIAVRDLIFTPIPRTYCSTEHPLFRRQRAVTCQSSRRSNRFGEMSKTRCTAPDIQIDYYFFTLLVLALYQSRNH